MTEVLDLGEQPLCNAFLNSKSEFSSEKRYPLKLVYCPKCSLVQLSEVLPREIVFPKSFNYLSSTSKSVREYYEALAKKHIRYFDPKRILEIAGNDGVYLKHFLQKDTEVLNVDPASAAVALAKKSGVNSIEGYFEDQEISFRPDFIVAFDVLAHAQNVHEILSRVASMMSDTTIFVSQFHSLREMVSKCEWDTCYHEHLRYFSLASFSYLLALHGFQIFSYEDSSFYGGSTVVYAKKRTPHIEGEIVTLQSLRTFERNVLGSFDLLDELKRKKESGERIVGIGAPMKSSTFLNYLRIGPEILDYLTEANPLKIGKWSPGMHIPVISDTLLFHDKPDVALVLSWNMFDEITNSLRENGLRETLFLNPHIFSSR